MKFDDEDVLSLSEAAKALPGKTSSSTVWRWATVGYRGVLLDTLRIGGRIFTSRRALQCFFEATSTRPEPMRSTSIPGSVVHADAELRKRGYKV